MRVVVVDDHPVFRKGLVALLSADGIEVVGEAENGLGASAVVAETSPDVVHRREVMVTPRQCEPSCAPGLSSTPYQGQIYQMSSGPRAPW